MFNRAILAGTLWLTLSGAAFADDVLIPVSSDRRISTWGEARGSTYDPSAYGKDTADRTATFWSFPLWEVDLAAC